jgi:hypothetical protein
MYVLFREVLGVGDKFVLKTLQLEWAFGIISGLSAGTFFGGVIQKVKKSKCKIQNVIICN